MMFGEEWGWHAGMGFGAGLLMVVFWVLVIAGLVALLRLLFSASGGVPGRQTGKTALEILEERFARGEIDAQEFEERRRILKGE